jgi:hypothetical protein
VDFGGAVVGIAFYLEAGDHNLHSSTTLTRSHGTKPLKFSQMV